MNYIFIIFSLLILDVISAQTKGDLTYTDGVDTSYVSFLYLGSDTLDYMDGGAGLTEIVIDSVYFDQSENYYYIYGNMIDGQTGESLNEWGKIILGKIILVEANTWLGFAKTGKIIRTGPEFQTSKKGFSFRINADYSDSIIFTMLGYSVLEIPLNKFLQKYFRE